ncbi:hypothetical protein BKA66DRAFT_475131 [Pyrenochaeta sp. MPI-SDFR-AT-0127]|nr:hypothetical protein BKA66DRAFT_475131 [Pyrenochaeta sp. MPI-SDFR-AT-0127]
MSDVRAQASLSNRAHNHGYRGRVRTGCITCRTRKVRCDELQPICNNCTKGKRQCVYRPWKNRRPVPNESRPVEVLPVHSLAANDSRQGSETSSTTQPFDNSPNSEHSNALVGSSQFGHTELLSVVPARDHSQAPSSPAVDIIARVESAHQHQNGGSFTIEDFEVENSSPSALISRDIKLTTTMDILAAGEIPWKPWITFFVDEVDFPIITPYDSINWRRAKLEIVDLGTSTSAIALATIALSALYRGQLHGLPLSRAQSLYHSAKSAYERLLIDETASFKTILATVFLLSLFNFIHYDSDPVLVGPCALFVQRLEEWTLNEEAHCGLSLRLTAWLRLLQVATTRGGGTGLVPEGIFTLFPSFDGKIPNLKPASSQPSDAPYHLLETLSTPILEFYFQLQMISADLARLTHYHRSRATGADQEEVVQQIAYNKSRLHTLWDNRTPIQQQKPEDLRCYLAPQIARPIITLIGICAAAYHSEFIEMNRVLGDPLSESFDAKNAMCVLREIVDGDYDAYDGGKLNPGYLRPLLLYAIECMDREKTHWAVNRLETIQNPICRSGFFASFGKALSDAQLLKGRRITSKYFAIWYFGVPPPFM